MGAAGFHGRVREGIGWFTRAMDHRVGVTSLGFLGSPGGDWRAWRFGPDGPGRRLAWKPRVW